MKWVDAKGDVCVGDIIRFTEAVFTGSYKRPQYKGDREIMAEVKKDSYGDEKQQHTFTLEILESSGTNPLEVGKTTRRKGRNVYRNGTERLLWEEEGQREEILREKHVRGGYAREQRAIRKEEY
tara:strand:+ start:194 stop:565 length:372 start_codon:yes stop_codon:yes gene_type:complete